MNIWLLCMLSRSVSLSNSLCISVFFLSLPFFCLSSHFRNFPLGVSNTNAKASLFSSIFPQKSHPPPRKKQRPKTENILHIYIDQPWISCPIFSRPCVKHTWLGCTWRLTFWPLPSRSWPLNSLLIIRPSPPMNLLPRESQETGSCDPVV